MIGLALHIVGIVLLILLCLGVLLCAALLNLPLRIQLRKRNETDAPLRLRLSAGPLHITRRIGGQKKAKPGKKQKKQAQTPEKKEKKSKQKRSWSERLKKLDPEQTMSLVLDLMDDLAGSITFERLHLTVILHTQDDGQTGNLLGGLSALVGLLYPVLEQNFVLRDPKIVLDADFDADKTVWSVDISAMTRLIRYPRILWKRRKRLWALWKSIK